MVAKGRKLGARKKFSWAFEKSVSDVFWKIVPLWRLQWQPGMLLRSLLSALAVSDVPEAGGRLSNVVGSRRMVQAELECPRMSENVREWTMVSDGGRELTGRPEQTENGLKSGENRLQTPRGFEVVLIISELGEVGTTFVQHLRFLGCLGLVSGAFVITVGLFVEVDGSSLMVGRTGSEVDGASSEVACET